MSKPIDILMVDDDPADVRLAKEALKSSKIDVRMSTAVDGQDCMEFLRRQGKHKDAVRPDAILLDLNMPRKNGIETLHEIKADPELRAIPVIILTTSDADQDILLAYREMAASFITKPVDLPKFRQVVQELGKYWTSVTKLPPKRAK